MSRFATQFARTGAPSLVRQFGESIVYYAGGGNAGRTIYALIERNVAVETSTGTTAQEIVVRVRNDATHGISATEINDKKDQVFVSLVVGGTPERRQITRINDDANGLVRFMVR